MYSPTHIYTQAARRWLVTITAHIMGCHKWWYMDTTFTNMGFTVDSKLPCYPFTVAVVMLLVTVEDNGASIDKEPDGWVPSPRC